MSHLQPTRTRAKRRIALTFLAGVCAVSLSGVAAPAHAATNYEPTPAKGFQGEWRYGPKHCDRDFYDPAYPKNNGKYAGLGGGTMVNLGGNRGGFAMLVKAGFGNDSPTLSETQELTLVANTVNFESRWCVGAFNREDFGLAQINKRYHPRLYRKYDLADPQQNLKAMRELFLASARTKSRSGRYYLNFERGLRPWHAHGLEKEIAHRPKMEALVSQWLKTQGRG